MDVITPADFNAHLAAAKLAELRQLQQLAATIAAAGPEAIAHLRELRLSLTAVLRTPAMPAPRPHPPTKTPPLPGLAATPQPALDKAASLPPSPHPATAEPHIPPAAVDALIAAVSAPSETNRPLSTQQVLNAARTILARAGAPPPS